jgi:hypothetical protein
MASRRTDEQLRIRVERLTATSAACQRFIKQHDELSTNVRIERHIDVIRMGQLMLELGVSKEMGLMDNENWASMSLKQKRARFIDVLVRENKLPGIVGVEAGRTPSPYTTSVALLSATQETPPAAPQAPQVDKLTDSTPTPEKPAVAPQVEAVSEVPPAAGNTQDVTTTEDGATFIVKNATTVAPGSIKGLNSF